MSSVYAVNSIFKGFLMNARSRFQLCIKELQLNAAIG
jgi:hypothetical protein